MSVHDHGPWNTRCIPAVNKRKESRLYLEQILTTSGLLGFEYRQQTTTKFGPLDTIYKFSLKKESLQIYKFFILKVVDSTMENSQNLQPTIYDPLPLTLVCIKSISFSNKGCWSLYLTSFVKFQQKE